MQTTMLKPRIVEVEQLGLSHARVVMEPFERGYGHTLGNALRRVLLSSMVGYAPTEVQISGVVHEYSTLDGVRDDVVDLLLNLKGVTFKLHNRDDVCGSWQQFPAKRRAQWLSHRLYAHQVAQGVRGLRQQR